MASLLQLRFELLGLTGLCVFPTVLFFVLVFGLELVPDLVLGEVCAEVRDLLVAWLACSTTTQNLNNMQFAMEAVIFIITV
jgi:hypothetical protein